MMNSDQDGRSGSKRINEYQGGAAPRARKMRAEDVAQMIVNKIAEIKELLRICKEFFERFERASEHLPGYIPARLDDEASTKIDALKKSIDNANFDAAVKSSFDKAAGGLLDKHRKSAWTVVVGSLLIAVICVLYAVNAARQQGRLEVQAEQYRQVVERDTAAAHLWRLYRQAHPDRASAFATAKGY